MATGALFGRYWEAQSPVHRLDPRTKTAGTLVLVVTVFCATTPLSLAVVAGCLAGMFALARIPLPQALRSIAPFAFIVVLTALFNLAYAQGGAVLVDWGWLTISEEGVRLAAFMAARLTLLLLAGSLLTLTTTAFDVTEALERLLSPLSRLRVPTHEFSLVLGLALRFIPEFANELRIVRASQAARGAKLATSPVKGGLSGLTSLLVPLFASAFRRADTLSSAMEARCYHGSSGRTRLHPLAFAHRDAIAAAALAVLLAASICLSALG